MPASCSTNTCRRWPTVFVHVCRHGPRPSPRRRSKSGRCSASVRVRNPRRTAGAKRELEEMSKSLTTGNSLRCLHRIWNIGNCARSARYVLWPRRTYRGNVGGLCFGHRAASTSLGIWDPPVCWSGTGGQRGRLPSGKDAATAKERAGAGTGPQYITAKLRHRTSCAAAFFRKANSPATTRSSSAASWWRRTTIPISVGPGTKLATHFCLDQPNSIGITTEAPALRRQPGIVVTVWIA